MAKQLTAQAATRQEKRERRELPGPEEPLNGRRRTSRRSRDVHGQEPSGKEALVVCVTDCAE